jgi:hypothetical protein
MLKHTLRTLRKGLLNGWSNISSLIEEPYKKVFRGTLQKGLPRELVKNSSNKSGNVTSTTKCWIKQIEVLGSQAYT